jgi:peptidoglycan/xylan/chitin deacetylase (PgdA/CDA1 family)
LKPLLIFWLQAWLLVVSLFGSSPAWAAGALRTPILAYHRFGAKVTDSMTVRTATFAWQLRYLREHGYTVIPLQDYVQYRRGLRPAPPERSVIITADDGHRSVYSEMLPLVQQYRIHVTLFIYPSAISNASYAMTWPQLAELVQSGLFDVQSHTYWHPNFRREAARLSGAQYEAFVRMQLSKSKAVLEHRLGISVDLLAWPFGIYDTDLIQQAEQAGYVAGLGLQGRAATPRDPLMALPRYLVTDRDVGLAFAQLLGQGSRVDDQSSPRPADVFAAPR